MSTTFTATDGTDYSYVGTTDECIQCEKCGKDELKSTVVLSVLDLDGNHTAYVYYGSTCAARALGIKGGGRAVLSAARGAKHALLGNARWAQEVLASFQLPETGDADDYALHYARLTYQLNHSRRSEQRSAAEWTADTVDMMRRHQLTLAHARQVGLKLDDRARVAGKMKVMKALASGLLTPLSEPGSLRINVRAPQGGQLTRVFLDPATGGVSSVDGPLAAEITTALELAARRAA